MWIEWLSLRRRIRCRHPRPGDSGKGFVCSRRRVSTPARNRRGTVSAGPVTITPGRLPSAACREELDLPEPPLRIEAFDISTIQGTNTVGSMVVMEDGMPKRSQYRRFEVKGLTGQDDFAAMEEVLTRRFRAYLAERSASGGAQQVCLSAIAPLGGWRRRPAGRAVKVVAEQGLDIPVAGLAKRMEEVYLPGEPSPCAFRGAVRRSTSSSRSGMRRTASPSTITEPSVVDT